MRHLSDDFDFGPEDDWDDLEEPAREFPEFGDVECREAAHEETVSKIMGGIL